MSKRLSAASILALTVLTVAFIWWRGAETISDAKAESGAETQSIDKRAGVFNDGQAALWDLNIIDHFRIFLARERVRGYAPEQPIKFSHVTHVKDNGINCQFCHWNVAKSPFAAIPEVETCNSCHGEIPGLCPLGLVPGTTEPQQQELTKLRELIKLGEPIPWQKVHVMPDHVRFNHKRHVKAGVTCQECHGQVPEMEVVERVSSMKMGWCLDCHRQRGTSIDCTTCHK